MSPYATIAATPDTLNWTIINPDTVAWGNASLTVYFDGDFGASTEFITIFGENNYQVGVTVPNANGNDCMLDSITLTIPSNLINNWAADDTIHFSGITTNSVDLFCTNNQAAIKLTYNYCTNGNPTQFASLSIPASSFCSIDPSVPVTVSPSGGTLSGPGLSGNTFNPSMLTPGTYVLNYTYTDGLGCTTFDEVTVTLNPGAFI